MTYPSSSLLDLEHCLEALDPEPGAPASCKPLEDGESGIPANFVELPLGLLRIPRLSMGKHELLPGTLDMMVLKTLDRGSLHGYAIAQLMRQRSDQVLQVEEGSLYPALQRLELNGWIEGEWGVSSNNRRARFYRLTADGRKKLASETARYREMSLAIARVMGMA